MSPLQLEHDIDPPAPSGPKPSLLDGESLTNVVAPIAYALARKRGGGGEFDGALHITNFRLILQRTGPGKVGSFFLSSFFVVIFIFFAPFFFLLPPY